MLAPIQPHRPSDSPDSGHLCLALSAQVASLEDLFILLDLPRIPPPPGSCPSPPQGRLAPSSVLLIPACLTDLSHLLAVTGLGLPPHHPAPAWEERLSASVSLLTSLSPPRPTFGPHFGLASLYLNHPPLVALGPAPLAPTFLWPLPLLTSLTDPPLLAPPHPTPPPPGLCRTSLSRFSHWAWARCSRKICSSLVMTSSASTCQVEGQAAGRTSRHSGRSHNCPNLLEGLPPFRRPRLQNARDVPCVAPVLQMGGRGTKASCCRTRARRQSAAVPCLPASNPGGCSR